MRSLLATTTAALALACVAVSPPAGAQPYRPPGAPHGGVGRAGREGPQAGERWRGGEWRHTWHGGRFGWWWTVDDDWFWYPEPVYPFPAEGPPAFAAEPPPPPPPPPPHLWYRCAAPAGFYPYVKRCPGGWLAVPAAPPSADAKP